MRNLRALERERFVVPKGACEAVVDRCLCRLLDRTPSERSEDKLVFLINDQPVELFARTLERFRCRADGHWWWERSSAL